MANPASTATLPLPACPSGREHVPDPASDQLALGLIGAAVKADIIGNHRRAFQHDDPVPDLEGLADRVGDKDSGLAVSLDEPVDIRAQPPGG